MSERTAQTQLLLELLETQGWTLERESPERWVLRRSNLSVSHPDVNIIVITAFGIMRNELPKLTWRNSLVDAVFSGTVVAENAEEIRVMREDTDLLWSVRYDDPDIQILLRTPGV